MKHTSLVKKLNSAGFEAVALNNGYFESVYHTTRITWRATSSGVVDCLALSAAIDKTDISRDHFSKIYLNTVKEAVTHLQNAVLNKARA